MFGKRHGARASAAGAMAINSTDRRWGLWLGLVVVLLCSAYASHLRLAQLAHWEREPQQYVASGIPMMTTLDAYYSLRIARLYAAGQFVPHAPVPARHYSRPEQADPNDWYDQREPKTLPLLSGVIAVASPLFGGDIDKTALRLPALLSSLFMIPLFLCCWRLGAPAAGVLGGLTATFCIEYWQRTSLGWVDTDSLNLFFPWTVSWLILTMRAEQRRATLLFLSAAAGAVLYVYFLWYGKPGITLAYVVALAAHLLLAGVSWRRMLLCVVALVIFANPAQFANVVGSLLDFVKRYLWPAAAQAPDVAAGLRFPQVWSTISEAQRLPWPDVLKRILGRADFVAIGLIAFIPFAVRRWRSMAALAPMLLLALLALVSSRRFIPYLAPFVGIGWGVIVSLLVKGVLSRLGGSTQRPGVQTAVSFAGAIALFAFAFAPVSGSNFVPRPAIPAPVFGDLQTLGQRLPANSRVWTWWDYGFAIVDTTRFGVYHDGAAQYTPQTNVVAASFVNPDPRVMYDAIAFVDREGNRGIRRLAASASDFDDLLSRMRDERPKPEDVPIYVLYTPDMLLKYPAMRVLAAPRPDATAGPRSAGIRWLDCERIVDDVLHCKGQRLDLRTGLAELIGNEPTRSEPVQLRRAVLVEGGRVLREREYAATAPLTVEIVLHAGTVAAVYLLDEAAFTSNLNQMFVLGRYDNGRFEEAFNDFPYTRVFRVLPPPK